MILNPGRLNRRITFYKNKTLQRLKAFLLFKMYPFINVGRLYIRSKVQTRLQNNIIQNIDQIKFVIRYTKKVTFDANMTIKFKDKVYRIIGITDPYDDMESLEILAESISRGNSTNDKTKGYKIMASIEFLNIDDLIDNIADAIAEYPVEAEKALNRTGLALKKN